MPVARAAVTGCLACAATAAFQSPLREVELQGSKRRGMGGGVTGQLSQVPCSQVGHVELVVLNCSYL